MVEDADRKSKKEAAAGAAPVESSHGGTRTRTEDAPLDKAESLFLPFAKPYNAYLDAVSEAHRSHQQTALETYNAYVKEAQEAIKASDAEALRSATKRFYTAWAELAKPTHLCASASRAFDVYRQELMSAVTSGAMNALGPGCLAVVAQSIAVVASHQMCYQRSLSGL